MKQSALSVMTFHSEKTKKLVTTFNNIHHFTTHTNNSTFFTHLT